MTGARGPLTTTTMWRSNLTDIAPFTPNASTVAPIAAGSEFRQARSIISARPATNSGQTLAGHARVRLPTNHDDMFTRKNYMDGDCTFEQYYDQFVTPEIIARVAIHIGADRIDASKDEHLNDIPLVEWDAIFGGVFQCGQLISSPTCPSDISAMLKERGDVGGASMATLVCIAKRAARHLVTMSQAC